MTEKLLPVKDKLKALKCCIIIPTYNNSKTILNVITSVRQYSYDIIIVNDGSTDCTCELINSLPDITIVTYTNNKGKGYALRQGFKKALDMNFEYAITIDSDGQHFADDVPAFAEKIEKEPGSLIVGARNMNQDGIPAKSSFGHKFSNFWFHLETGINLPDTQSGYRLYPIKLLQNMQFYTKKYEFEIEVMVRAAWKGIPIVPIPIKVFYAQGNERVSHFRPFKDFSRISVLNTVLVFLTIVYAKPKQFIKKLIWQKIRHFFKNELINSSDSNIKLAASAAFGVFMGIVPIWGYQLLVGIPLALIMRLNKTIFFVAANISFPPMIPMILYLSYLTGAHALNMDHTLAFSDISFESIKHNFKCYIIGSLIFATIMSACVGFLTWLVLTIFRKTKASNG